jgi:hypothetical protein
MKVIYQSGIVKRILDAKLESYLSNSIINHIELLRSEAVELFDVSTNNFVVQLLQPNQSIDDVKINAVNGSSLFGLLLKVGSK